MERKAERLCELCASVVHNRSRKINPGGLRE